MRRPCSALGTIPLVFRQENDELFGDPTPGVAPLSTSLRDGIISGAMSQQNGDSFVESGYIVLPELLDRDRADELYRAFDELPLGGSPASVPGAAPGRLQANERALVRDARFFEVLREPALLEKVEYALGEDIHLLAYEAVEIPAGGGKARDWHCDFHFPTDAPLVVNRGIYLQDMEDERAGLFM